MPPDPARDVVSDQATSPVANSFTSWACPNNCGNGVGSSDKHPTWHCWRCRVDAVEVEYVTLRREDYDRLRAENEEAVEALTAFLAAYDRAHPKGGHRLPGVGMYVASEKARHWLKAHGSPASDETEATP